MCNDLIDDELIGILNTPIGAQRNGVQARIKDCLNDYTLYLEKCLYKNPFSNEYLHLDSFACESLLSESTIRVIKNLVTRINIKNYIISFKYTTSSSICSETKALAIETIKDSNGDNLYSINDALNYGLLDKTTLCYKNDKTGALLSLNDAYEQGYVNGTSYYDGQKKCLKTSWQLIYEDLSYQIKYIIDPDTNTKLRRSNKIRRF